MSPGYKPGYFFVKPTEYHSHAQSITASSTVQNTDDCFARFPPLQNLSTADRRLSKRPVKRLKIAVHEPPRRWKDRKQTMYQLMELLGIHRQRVVFVAKEVHFELTGYCAVGETRHDTS